MPQIGVEQSDHVRMLGNLAQPFHFSFQVGGGLVQNLDGYLLARAALYPGPNLPEAALS